MGRVMEDKLNELALFAGAGGGILGGILSGFRTVCAVEIDPFCREVLLRRQLDGCLPKFPVWDDIKTFDGKPWRGKIDIITAGFPCQPFSVAGKQKGEADERNMWPDTVRVIREIRPEYCLLENVPGLASSQNKTLYTSPVSLESELEPDGKVQVELPSDWLQTCSGVPS